MDDEIVHASDTNEANESKEDDPLRPLDKTEAQSDKRIQDQIPDINEDASRKLDPNDAQSDEKILDPNPDINDDASRPLRTDEVQRDEGIQDQNPAIIAVVTWCLFLTTELLQIILAIYIICNERSITHFTGIACAVIPFIAVGVVGCLWRCYLTQKDGLSELAYFGVLLGVFLHIAVTVIGLQINWIFHVVMWIIAFSAAISALFYHKRMKPINVRKSQDYIVTLGNVFMTFLALSMYALDILFDITLFIFYICNREIWYGILTLLFVILPGMYITLKHRWNGTINNNTETKWQLILTCIFNLTPTFLYSDCIKLYRNSKTAEENSGNEEQERIYHTLLKKNREVAASRRDEAFLEAAPQLTLQIYILLVRLKNNDAGTLQLLSVITSCFSLAWSNVMDTRSKRLLRYIVDPLTLKGFMVHYLNLFPTTVSRILSISSCLTSPYLLYTSIAVMIHWIGMVPIRYFCLADRRNQSTIQKLVESAGDAFTDIFRPCMKTAKIAHCFYFLFFLENIGMAIVYFYNLSTCIWYNYFIIVVGILGPCIGAIFRYVYDKCEDNLYDWSDVPINRRPPDGRVNYDSDVDDEQDD